MRNFLYNKSDILVAAIIIIVAAIIIWTRVGAIMDTNPATVGAGTGSAIGTVDTPESNVSGEAVLIPPPDVSSGGAATPPATTTAAATPATTKPAAETPPPPPKVVKFKISGDANSDDVARDLAADGLVESASAFSQRLMERGKDTMIRGGTFNITQGMSIDQIIDLIAN